MTNSIWHKANEKPELNKYVVVRKHGFAQWKVLKFDNKTTFFEPFTDDLWAYMADVITQADKAELQADKAKRLQKAVDNYEKVIVGAMFAPDVGDVTAGMLEESHKTIKQLIKGGVNETHC